MAAVTRSPAYGPHRLHLPGLGPRAISLPAGVVSMALPAPSPGPLCFSSSSSSCCPVAPVPPPGSPCLRGAYYYNSEGLYYLQGAARLPPHAAIVVRRLSSPRPALDG